MSDTFHASSPPICGATYPRDRSGAEPETQASAVACGIAFPAIVAGGGRVGSGRRLEIVAVTTRSPNTHRANVDEIGHFITWCGDNGLMYLGDMRPADAGRPEAPIETLWQAASSHARTGIGRNNPYHRRFRCS